MASKLPKTRDGEAKRTRRGALSVMTRPMASGGTVNDDNPERDKGSKSADALARAVGKEIRSLRLSLNMTASALAKAADVSNGMLSKIENGTATPSFATLTSIAEVLKVPVARLFASHDQKTDYSLVRAGSGISVQRRGRKAGLTYELLGHLLSGEKYIEPYLVTITDQAAPSPGFQHTGIEILYMLEGEMTYRYADALVDLGPGDTMLFDANFVHGHERLTKAPVRFLSFVFNLRT